jgi:DNA-directed RNA polymerase subunit RPC12/RpoP
MSKKEENRSFTCAICNQHVKALENGSYRNHCPFCLGSIHVDNKPGDRNSQCKGLMTASQLKYNSKKGWQIIHKCQKCGIEKANKIAESDSQGDDWEKLIKLSQNK